MNAGMMREDISMKNYLRTQTDPRSPWHSKLRRNPLTRMLAMILVICNVTALVLLALSVASHADERNTAKMFSDCIQGDSILIVNTGERIKCFVEPAGMSHPVAAKGE